jgi:hypothetical protein
MKDFDIISFHATRELEFTEDVIKALGLPAKDGSWHPLNIPVETLDPRFEYRWKAYAISEKAKYEIGDAQQQVIANLKESINKGWFPVESLWYPHLLTPSIRKYSTGKFIRYNGLMLFCKFKQLGLEFQSMGGINESTISFSTPLLTGKHTYSLPG